MKKDDIFVKPLDRVEDFAFDARVADVFDNMISRSVPGYRLTLDLIGLIAERYARDETNCYDLGCSLGAATLMLRRHVPATCHVIGVDNSSAMIERCRASIQRDHSGATVELREQDLQATVIENASVVVLNFTLQFVPPDERATVLESIARGINPGGALLLAEKVAFEKGDEDTFIRELHHDFKRYHGYSDLEIAQKRAALENVMIPETAETHISRLHQSGFDEVFEISRCLNFAAFLAVRVAA